MAANTNTLRAPSFMRIIVIGIIAEFKGDLLDVTEGDKVLNYSLDGILLDLFAGTPGHAEMARKYKTFLLILGDKSSRRRHGEFFRRYVNVLAKSPKRYFRMRDTNALCRFTIAVALACSDQDDVWFTKDQFNMLAEIGDTICTRPETAYVTSFLRYFGGPLYIMMRRYRFVEENMTISKEEDIGVVL
ncbi:hypothetical protein D6C89_07578 [Aureobasidium pullulans]|nr:hypothetical protein D6C89_07578 [Aureobasidium pullulans]